jgi:hypothetical protein
MFLFDLEPATEKMVMVVMGFWALICLAAGLRNEDSITQQSALHDAAVIVVASGVGSRALNFSAPAVLVRVALQFYFISFGKCP